MACQDFVGIEEKDPVVGQGQCIHGPLALFGPAAAVVELDNFGAIGFGDAGCVVGTLGVDQIDFANVFERGETARQVVRLIACGDDHAHGKRGRGAHGG
jgi:hypothetical protein